MQLKSHPLRHPLFMGALSLLLCTAAFVHAKDADALVETDPGLVGEYFMLTESPSGFPDVAGKKPSIVRVDKQLNFTGNFNGLGLQDNFFARWTGLLRVEKPGKYSLLTIADDAARVFVHDKLISEGKKESAGKEATGTVELTAGDHALRVEYVQTNGKASVQLGWIDPSGAKFLIPDKHLVHEKGKEKIEFDQSAAQKLRRKAAPAWVRMDYGSFISASIVAPQPEKNLTVKGVAITLGEPDGAGNSSGIVFDTALLRASAGWTNGGLRLDGVAFSGGHGQNPAVGGTIALATKPLPGWARPGTSEFTDPRPEPYGMLPRDWAHYKGMYRNGKSTVVAYTVGKMDVLELAGIDSDAISRTIRTGPSEVENTLRVADAAATAPSDGPIDGAPADVKWEVKDGATLLHLPATKEPLLFKITYGKPVSVKFAKSGDTGMVDPESLLKGGPARWGDAISVKGELGGVDPKEKEAPYVVDTIPVPESNPYDSWMRTSGFDFFKDGKTAAICTWSGDVWIVTGIDEKLENLKWKRFAAGLFQPLGLKIVDEKVYVLERSQITRLHDLNNDGEADFYENFNNDVTISEGFHAFAFDLHTDAEGNFYFIMGGPVNPGGRGFEHIVKNHGSVMKVSKDGSSLETVATGFRAPNGMGVGPKGEVTSGDNQGSWTPACRLNWIKPGGFYGVVDLAHRETPPTQTDNPLCWFPMGIDNSSGGQVWVTSDKWGPFTGDLLHMSYGKCKLFKVLKEEVGGQVQGGVVRFPLKFVSSVMRGRFNPVDGQLYLCGLKGWQTDASRDSGFQRVRYTGKPVRMPKEMHVKDNGIEITFTCKIDPKSVTDASGWSAEAWNYRWTSDYGSPEFKVSSPAQQGHDQLEVKGAKLSEDGTKVFLEIPNLQPAMQVRIKYNIDAADGAEMEDEIFSSINALPNGKHIVVSVDHPSGEIKQ